MHKGTRLVLPYLLERKCVQDPPQVWSGVHRPDRAMRANDRLHERAKKIMDPSPGSVHPVAVHAQNWRTCEPNFTHTKLLDGHRPWFGREIIKSLHTKSSSFNLSSLSLSIWKKEFKFLRGGGPSPRGNNYSLLQVKNLVEAPPHKRNAPVSDASAVQKIVRWKRHFCFNG